MKETLKKVLEKNINIYQDLVNRYPNNKQHQEVLKAYINIYNICVNRGRF